MKVQELIKKFYKQNPKREDFYLIVYAFLGRRTQDGEVLLQRRQGTKLWPGYLALPAGHIDEGENAYEAAIREAREELGIEIATKDIVDTFVVNRRNKSLMSYYDVYFEINSYNGKIEIKEPEKCQELVWCNINNLPQDMIDFEITAIKNNQKGIKFSVIDVDNEKKLV